MTTLTKRLGFTAFVVGSFMTGKRCYQDWRISKMKELAERSNKDPANHKTLENEKHSAEFKAKHQSL